MTAKEERAYEQGSRAVWQRLAVEAAGALGRKDPIGKLASLVAEMEAARAALRRVCAAHGDNDWDDDLHLADVIEKHLARHLDG